jgi:hypothetical protein
MDASPVSRPMGPLALAIAMEVYLLAVMIVRYEIAAIAIGALVLMVLFGAWAALPLLHRAARTSSHRA